MDPYHPEFAYEELIFQGMQRSAPMDPDEYHVWLAARELWPTAAEAAAEAAANAAIAANAASNSGNNNDDDDNLAVAPAGPATAELQGLIDPDLPPPFPAVAVAVPAPAPAHLPAPPAAAATPPAAAASAPGPAYPEPVVSPALRAIIDAATPGSRRAWTEEEDAYLLAARLAGHRFDDIGKFLKRTDKACETRAKGRVYKGGKKPGDK